MTVQELIEELQRLGGVLDPRKIEVGLESPTGAAYAINKIEFNVATGMFLIQGRRDNRPRRIHSGRH